MQQDDVMAPNDRVPADDGAAVSVTEAPPRRRVRRRVAATPPMILPEASVTAITDPVNLPSAASSEAPLAAPAPQSPIRESTEAGTSAPFTPLVRESDRLEAEEDELPEPDPERTGGRRRRGRRGRRPPGAEDGFDPGTHAIPASRADDFGPSSTHDMAAEDSATGAPDEASRGALVREDFRPTADQTIGRSDGSSRRESSEYAGQTDGREARQSASYERSGRPDGRSRRDWADQRESRDGQRSAPRDRSMLPRERGFAPGRDNRQNGSAQREQARESQPHREGRDVAGYREVRDRGADAAPPRPTEVVTRGYVIAVDQNQTQWQLRTHGHLSSPQDATISMAVVRANGLRMGDEVVGLVRSAAPGRRFGELLDVQSINGIPIDRVATRPRFDDLTPIYPDRLIRLERPDSITARIIDIVCPVGFGQRAMIVSPPKAGKTTILKEIGRSININYPEVKLIVCLVGERPEEVTDLAKSLKGEIISSTFDEAINHHTELAEITIERARRLVESGFDVVVLLDSVTRLARAYNLSAPGDSRSLSGGMATTALYPPKRFFGAARALEEGGSLTVIATCLVDTNSRLDDVIYEELKGTGNMELVLDRRLAEERVFPAIDIVKSSTRREELLLQPNELTAVMRLRRVLAMGNDPINSTQRVVQQMERTRTNAEFLASLLTQSSAR